MESAQKTAQLDQCPIELQTLVIGSIREARGTNRGRRAILIENGIIRAVQSALQIDPTRQENHAAITELLQSNPPTITTAVRTEVQRIYGKEPAETTGSITTEPATAKTTTTDPVTAEQPEQQPQQSQMEALGSQVFDYFKTLGILQPEELKSLIDETVTQIGKAQGIEEELARLLIERLAQTARIKAEKLRTSQDKKETELATQLTIFANKLDPREETDQETTKTKKDFEYRLDELAREGNFIEGIHVATEAINLFSGTHEIQNRRMGFEVAFKILQRPSIITSLEGQQLLTASYILEKSGNLELALECLTTLQNREMIPSIATATNRRIQKIAEHIGNPNTTEDQEKRVNHQREVLDKCHGLERQGDLKASILVLKKAIEIDRGKDLFPALLIGLQVAIEIREDPTSIKSYTPHDLWEASFPLERAGEYKLAITCLEKFGEKNNLNYKSRQRLQGLKRQLSNQLSVTPQQPTTKPQDEPKTQEPETPKTAEEISSALAAFLDGVEAQSRRWKTEERDSILIIPENRIDQLVDQLESALTENAQTLYAKHIEATKRTNLQNMVEQGLFQGIKSGRLKVRYLRQIKGELESMSR